MDKKQKNLLVGSLIAIIFIMAVGFAGFTQQLKITETSSVTSDWNIGFSSATPGTVCSDATTSSKTACGSVTTFSEGAKAISFASTLYSPGDTVTYTVIVKNSGSVDAKLTSYTPTYDNQDSLLKYSISGLEPGTTTVTAGGGTVTFTVTVTFDNQDGKIEAQQNGMELNLDWVSI